MVVAQVKHHDVLSVIEDLSRNSSELAREGYSVRCATITGSELF
jgi:hypothetical protein